LAVDDAADQDSRIGIPLKVERTPAVVLASADLCPSVRPIVPLVLQDLKSEAAELWVIDNRVSQTGPFEQIT
jgi:hypothetical protein